ncbi:MAG: cell division protein FtsA [Candidatus Paceibacterota bacterium]
MNSRYIVGLDIGSQNIKAAIAERSAKGYVLIDLLTFPSAGIRRGVVENHADASQAIANALGKIQEIAPRATKNLILSVGSEDVHTQISTGVVAVSSADEEIYADDVTRVIQAAQAVNLSANRTVLHSITKEYIVDGNDKVKDPIGMLGKRLEVNCLIIDAFNPNIKNLVRCVEEVGGGVLDVVLSPLAASHATLSKNQKELGVVLLDIGFGKTSLAIYEEEQLIHTAIIPIGSGHISNDLAIGLRVPVEAAELVKRSFGNAQSKSILKRDTIDLAKLHAKAKGVVSKKFIAEIIEARLSEIFEHALEQIKKESNINHLPAGVVLVGAGSLLKGVDELAKKELKLPVQHGQVNLGSLRPESPDLALEGEKPEFAVAIGLLLHHQLQYATPGKRAKHVGSFFQKVLNYFIP